MIKTDNWAGINGISWDQWLIAWLCNNSVNWTLLNLDKPIDNRFGEFWQKYCGAWNHQAGATRAHNSLGMAYAGWAIWHGAVDEIRLVDSPDIRAKLGNNNVVGDIGTCTIAAFCDGLNFLVNRGDLWMSILDHSTQIILEFGFPFSLLLNHLRWLRMGSPFGIDSITASELSDLMGRNRPLTGKDVQAIEKALKIQIVSDSPQANSPIQLSLLW